MSANDYNFPKSSISILGEKLLSGKYYFPPGLCYDVYCM